ncbi:Gfo/Idh/MocA family protein [Stieleria sp.]|uniref:Gfo/Idh/MocA family protein n=1 Tax=Stieleria sp. TaxID=2795976 RepID=UPI003561CAD4
MENHPSRRNFLKTSTAAAAGATLTSTIARTAHAQGSDEIKFALIGCGGRGNGASVNIFKSGGNTKLVAVADAFDGKASATINSLSKRYKDKVDVPADRKFVGLDAYKKLLEVDADLVIIATPPGFKPQQFEAAVKAGKHIFMEKPVASDATGVRRVLASVEESKKKNLMVGIGLQRRHEAQYLETIGRIHDGAIGDVIATRVYWNGGGIWYRNRTEEQTEMAFQCNNWYHFNWLSGDQICEQHIHNLDVGCWLKGEYPVECNGMGGREQRMDGDPTKSQIFDHTFCEYTFADGTKMFSQGRHLKGSWTHVAEYAHGTKGTADVSGSQISGEGGDWKFSGERQQGHQQEQNDLIAALARGEIYNEGEYGALSTFTAILGREACYSGKVIKWDDLLNKGRELAPGIDDYTIDSPPPESALPGPDGKYPIPVPGQYDPFA